VPVTAEAWSAWQNVSTNVPVVGNNGQFLAASRRADGRWRHRISGVLNGNLVESQVESNNACSVAIANSRRVYATVNNRAHAEAHTQLWGNTSGWNLLAQC